MMRCMEIRMFVEVEAEEGIPDWVIFGEIIHRASEVCVITGNVGNGAEFTIDAFSAGFKHVANCGMVEISEQLHGYDGQDVGLG